MLHDQPESILKNFTYEIIAELKNEKKKDTEK